MELKQNQKTTIPEEKTMKKEWFIVDVKGKTLGKSAAKIANILRGKDKPFFTPQLDCGDYVIAINVSGVRLAGNKMETKKYQWHTQYPGGFRERSASEMMAKKPEKILFQAVSGMLPRNRTRKHLMRHLHIFPSEIHTHAAQNPKQIEI